MTPPSTRRSNAARLVLRVAIGLVLFTTAAGKLLDVAGFARILGAYAVFPDASLLVLAWAVPLAELALAVWLFSGVRLEAAAWSSVGLHGSYAAWSAASLLRGLKLSNCGCFGVFLPRPLTWSTVAEDGVMVALSGALALLARRR